MGSKYKYLLCDELNGNVKKYFFDCDFRINLPNCAVRIPVPGDVHCILYAWEIGLTASTSSNIKPRVSSNIKPKGETRVSNKFHNV